MDKIDSRSLYLIITEEFGRGRTGVEIARKAIAGGVDIIQMREKNKPHDELVAKGKALLAVCREAGVPFIVNDDPRLAGEIGADGVHLGQEDIKQFSVKAAREMLGKDSIIGISAGSLDQLKEARRFNVDYIGFGPVFHTRIKEGSVNKDDIKKAVGSTRTPIFFIGGIDLHTVDTVIAGGGRRIAVITAIMESEDIEGAARRLKKKLDSK